MVQVIPKRHSLVFPVFQPEVKLLLGWLGMDLSNGFMVRTPGKESTSTIKLLEVLFVPQQRNSEYALAMLLSNLRQCPLSTTASSEAYTMMVINTMET